MTRILPDDEYSPAQQARVTLISPATARGWDVSADTSSTNRAPFRRMRLGSVPLETDMLERMSDLSVNEDSEEPLDARRTGGIRGLIRRASVSLKNRKRRHSHATEERPSSSSSPWHRLRQATSFNRNSRVISSHFNFDGPVDSCSELASPTPGHGGAPPIIPAGTGGAARATAAARISSRIETF
ncbi:f-box and wd40 domain-containing protein [Botrytis cinerea]